MHYVIDHSESRWLVVESLAMLRERIAPILGKIPRVQRIVLWDWDDEARKLDARCLSLAEVCALGRAAHERDGQAWTRACEAARPEDLAVLIYTSGTTGQPKGAMLTHANVVAMEDSLTAVLPALEPDAGAVSFLPMAHAAERCVAHYSRIRTGYATHFSRGLENLLQDIGDARPTLFGSVPRIFEKVYAKVQGDLAAAQGLRGHLARAAYRAGMEAWGARRRGERPGAITSLLAGIFDKKIASVLRARFGGRCGWFISGAAPIAVDILEFFDACGFKTYEVYGLTETTGLLTTNRVGAERFGTVGQAMPGVELRIAEDGEILARGKNVFQGYFKDEEATRAAIDEQGWFHTGDIGTLSPDGYLKITDRKKNILITAGGKNITPSNIESEVKAHPLISYCHLHADRRPFPTALVCLDPQQLEKLAQEKGLRGRTAAELKDDPAVREVVQGAIDRANARFAQFERIKKFAILPEEFSITTGELTPTLKVKRKDVEKKYAAVLEALYAESAGGRTAA
jgi:long-chain acyl-CoA synthetase